MTSKVMLIFAAALLLAAILAVNLLLMTGDMPLAEIATTLGISRGTVMSRLFRARGKLKNLLEDYL